MLIGCRHGCAAPGGASTPSGCCSRRPSGPAVLELLAGEDEPLLARRDALLVLDLGLHVLDRVAALDLQRDGLARQHLDNDLASGFKLQTQCSQ